MAWGRSAGKLGGVAVVAVAVAAVAASPPPPPAAVRLEDMAAAEERDLLTSVSGERRGEISAGVGRVSLLLSPSDMAWEAFCREPTTAIL